MIAKEWILLLLLMDSWSSWLLAHPGFSFLPLPSFLGERPSWHGTDSTALLQIVCWFIISFLCFFRGLCGVKIVELEKAVYL
jgi:hypothetical protein